MAKARVLTRSELAEHLGVDKKMVTKWERSGMPVHTRGRGVASQFRLREVRQAWWRTRSIVTRRSSGRRCGLERWRGNEAPNWVGRSAVRKKHLGRGH